MNEEAHRPLVRIIRAADAQSWIDGYALMNHARREAEALRKGVEAEISAAREAGRAEGRAAGEAEAGRLATRTQAEVDRYLSSLDSQIAELSLSIVRRVIGDLDAADLVARLAAEAIAGLRDEAGLTVHVAPGLEAEVEAALRAAGAPARVMADKDLSGRRCIVTTPATSIDIGLDAQLEAIRETMAQAPAGGR